MLIMNKAPTLSPCLEVPCLLWEAIEVSPGSEIKRIERGLADGQLHKVAFCSNYGTFLLTFARGLFRLWQSVFVRDTHSLSIKSVNYFPHLSKTKPVVVSQVNGSLSCCCAVRTFCWL